MTAERLLLAAVAMQRDGIPPDRIENLVIEIARREEPGCQYLRGFGGHTEIVFTDGQHLKFDGHDWTLVQQEQLAPLYISTLADLTAGRSGHAPIWGN